MGWKAAPDNQLAIPFKSRQHVKVGTSRSLASPIVGGWAAPVTTGTDPIYRTRATPFATSLIHLQAHYE